MSTKKIVPFKEITQGFFLIALDKIFQHLEALTR
jgi:hypothetical protein